MGEVQAIQKVEKRESVGFTVQDLQTMARAIAGSGLFGIKSPDQALSLMLIAQAEGRHPALAARDYDIIQGRPSKKAEAMLRDFLEAGGKVQWLALDDNKVEATFSHALGGTATIAWDMERAKVAALAGKDMFKKYPRQMLRSRVVSEGIRTVWPSATSGFYVPEETSTFDADASAASNPYPSAGAAEKPKVEPIEAEFKEETPGAPGAETASLRIECVKAIKELTKRGHSLDNAARKVFDDVGCTFTKINTIVDEVVLKAAIERGRSLTEAK